MQKEINHFEIFPNHELVKKRIIFFGRLIYKIIPRNVYLPFRNELHFFKLRIFSAFSKRKFRNTRNAKLNIGAGPKGKPGWINIDAYKIPGINCVCDCRTSLPFPDNSASLIFCEHFVEHLDYTEEIPYFISECHRVLEKGGIIRIIVPDIELYLRGYIENDWETLKKVRPLENERTDSWIKCEYANKMELINMLFRQGIEHKYAYDYEAMEYVLKRFGFKNICRQSYGNSLNPALAIDSPERRTESLYVEAVKE
jgi:predicted SAM-dependent methyltransferase